MGAVYEAEDQRLGITVALKETLSSEESMRRQFEREARLLARMQHPALPRVSDHFVEGSRAFLVMQFIGGVDLAKIMSQQPGPFPRDQVVVWAEQLLDALIYLHAREQQVIHRDIKPHNLKLNANGQIALLDFGLAKTQPSDPSVTASHAFFGYTRHYAPLEQIQDQRTDPRSDIYGLGATLYHLSTGIKPPDAMVRATAVVNGMRDPLRAAHHVNRSVGRPFAALLHKALAQKPEARFQTADEFREALRRLEPGEPHTTVVNKEPAKRIISSAIDPPHVKEDQAHRSTSVRVPTEVNMVLVGSARRFGPGGATAVLALIVAFTTGIIYGAQSLFPEADKVLPASVTEAAAMREFPIRKDSATTNTARGKQNVVESNRQLVKLTDAALKGTQTEQRLDSRKTQNTTRGGSEMKSSALRKALQRFAVPSNRLPQPEVRQTPERGVEVRGRTTSSNLHRRLLLRKWAAGVSAETPGE